MTLAEPDCPETTSESLCCAARDNASAGRIATAASGHQDGANNQDRMDCMLMGIASVQACRLCDLLPNRSRTFLPASFPVRSAFRLSAEPSSPPPFPSVTHPIQASLGLAR